MRLKNTVAIITGGGTGIGRGIALQFAKEEASVVVVGRRAEPLHAVAEEIDKKNGVGMTYVADVSSEKQIESMVDAVLNRFGTIDILVNNAGIASGGDVISVSEKDWDHVLCVDLNGDYLTAKTVLPEMIKKGKGKIINIASIAGIVGFEQSAAYCAAKGAVIMLTKQMALDYGKNNININAIAPGFITTDMTKLYLENAMLKQETIRKTPIGRIGTPEDIAYAAVYLASKESDFMTGQTLIIDGGWTIQ